jgi:hypothetical protein
MMGLRGQKMLFGFLLLLLLALLAGVIAISKVEEQTSHGLIPVITALATLAGGFAQWAFRSDKDEE